APCTPRCARNLLRDAGSASVRFHWPNLLYPGTTPDDVAITEQSTNMRYNSVGGLYQPKIRLGDRYSERFALSYITGSHAFKTGIQWDQGRSDTENIGTGRPGAKGLSYIFNRGVPVSLRDDAIFH